MKAIKIWLWTGVIMVLVQVMLGGITRLTESGLSITEWDVVMGSLPPMNAEQWNTEFEHYKSSAQFEKVNTDFTVDQFKHIYWWEFIHRLWARLIGFVFLLPFIYFLIKKMIPKGWVPKLLVVFLLGGLQGFVGWVMVASGLDGDPWVDPSKLTIHLLLALIVFMYLIWLALSLRNTPVNSDHPTAHKAIKWILVFILLQISFGGLMAGTDAGRLFNTWPLMNGRFIPQGAFQGMGAAEKLTQLTTEINFVHRTFAMIVALAIFIYWLRNRLFASSLVHKLNSCLLILVGVQFILGVLTLLGGSENIPVFLGVAHQFTACILLGVAVAITYYTKNRKAISAN